MSMLTRRRATAPAGTVTEDQIAELVREIETYLSAPGRATAHPLVTRPTADLVAEALAAVEAGCPRPSTGDLRAPSRILRRVPDRLLPLLRPVAGPRRHITVAEHLELTARVLETYGWATGNHRTPGGRRCILGAQAVLYRLGYGDRQHVDAAAGYIRSALADHGVREDVDYWTWNDQRAASVGEVTGILRAAAAAAARERR